MTKVWNDEQNHKFISGPRLTAMNSFRITALLLVLICVPALAFSSADISSVLEKKGPRAKEVLTKPTLTRVSALPGLPVSIRQYEFLLDHPRLSLVLAHSYDPSLDSYKVTLRPDGLLHVDDPAGLAGDVDLISADRGRRIYFIAGYYDLLKMRFHGRMVLMTEYSVRSGEEEPVNTTTTGYIKIDSAVAGVFAKIIAFLFPQKVDARIGRFLHAVRVVSFAVHNDPPGAIKRLAASGQVSAEEVREFAEIFIKKTPAGPGMVSGHK
jgi:hypothetical protein